MNYITKHKRIIYVPTQSFILIRKKSLSYARECFYNLSCWYKDVRLYYNHLRFRQSLFYHFFCFIWLLVINQQVKRIFFFKGSNYTNCITWLHPKLLRPPSNQCHSKKYWTVHKANKYWVTILVHGWAQFQLHYS